MKYKVLTIAPFEKQFKRLGKKYPSLKNEITELISELKIKPDLGTSLGNDCFKIRLGIASKGKGKSGGARLLLILRLLMIRYSSYPFTTNLNNQT